MVDNQPDPERPQPQHDVVARIIAAMAELGAAGAGHIADTVGIAYSTTTAKLRALEAQGRAEKFRTDDRRTLWQLTPNGQPSDSSGDEPVDGPGPEDDPGTEPEVLADGGPDLGVEADDAGTDPDAAGCEGGSTAPPDDSAPAEQPPAPQPQPATVSPATTVVAVAAPVGPDIEPGTGPGPDTAPVPAVTVADGAEAAAAPEGSGAPVNPRRRQGELRNEVLAVLQAEPDHSFGATELSRRLDGASQGAISNALAKLVTAGNAHLAQDKPTRWKAVLAFRNR